MSGPSTGNVLGHTGLGRVDEGVDFSGRGPVLAPTGGRITYVSTHTGWPGGTFIIQDTGQSGMRRYIYYAENISPSVHVGQRVKAGDRIGYAPGVYPFIEVGWAAGPHVDLAYAHGHYTEGQQTAEGKDFLNWLFHGGGKAGGKGAAGGGGGGGGGFDPIGAVVDAVTKEGLRMLLYVVLVFGGIAAAGLGTVRAAGVHPHEGAPA